MKSHWELFQEHYNQASAEQQSFVDKNVFIAVVDKLSNTLEPEQKRDLIWGSNLIILGYKDIDNLQSYLTTFSEDFEIAKQLMNQLTSLFITIDDYKKYSNQSISGETRTSVKEQLSEKALFLLENANSITKLYFIAYKHNLRSADLYKKFAITIGDIILGFYNIADTEPLLIQELDITPEAAQALTPDILEFLTPLSDPDWQPPMDENKEYEVAVATDNEPSDTYITPEQPMVAGENETITEMHTTAQPMRTMQQDMARSPQRSEFEPMTDDTPVYTSEQPTNEHDVPSYTQTKQTSRWDSEQE